MLNFLTSVGEPSLPARYHPKWKMHGINKDGVKVNINYTWLALVGDIK